MQWIASMKAAEKDFKAAQAKAGLFREDDTELEASQPSAGPSETSQATSNRAEPKVLLTTCLLCCIWCGPL